MKTFFIHFHHMNQLEEQKKIAKDLIDIIRSDIRMPNDSRSIEVVALMFLLVSKNYNQPLYKIAPDQIIHFIEDQIREINPNIWNILEQTLREVNIETLLTFDNYLRNYRIDQTFLSDLFEDILYEQARDYSRVRGEFIQPVEVTKFICKLIESKDTMEVYNPFSGMASYGVKLDNHHHYIGQEISESTWVIGWIRLFLNNSFYLDFENKDSILNWLGKYKQFDLIISTPPFQRINRHFYNFIEEPTIEEFLVKNGIKALKKTGKLVCLLSEGFFFNNNISNHSLRREIVEKGYVDMVISLPSNTMYATTIKTSILVLNRNKETNDIKFVDGSRFFTNHKGKNIFQFENLLREIRNDKSEQIRQVSIAEVRKMDYRLDVPTYFLDDIDVPDGFNKIKLKDILTYNNTRITLVKDENVLSISDLKNNPFDSPINSDLLEANKKNYTNKSVYYSNRDILLISPRFKTLKPTYYKINKSGIYYSSNIAGFYIKAKDIIDINYLIYELNADYVKEQINAFSIGTVMPYMRVNNFLEIEILIPPLDTQLVIVNRAKTTAAEEKLEITGLKNYIEKEKDKYKQVLNIRTHRIRPFLSGLSDNLDLLFEEFQDRGSVSINDEVIPNYNVRDLLSNMKECMSNMKSLIRNLTQELSIGKKEVFDIKEFIDTYSYKKKNQSITYSIKKEFDKESFKIRSNSAMSYNVSFNKGNLSEIIDLIIENAELHGFSNNDKLSNEVILSISYLPDSSFILLSIKNNGLPMAGDFSEEHFFASGIISGATGNTGIGGFRIKDVVDQLGGKIHLFNNPSSEYPVEIQIYLPISL